MLKLFDRIKDIYAKHASPYWPYTREELVEIWGACHPDGITEWDIREYARGACLMRPIISCHKHRNAASRSWPLACRRVRMRERGAQPPGARSRVPER